MARTVPGWRAVDWLGLAAVVVLVALAVRLAGVAAPATMYFDEYHDAR